MNLTKPFLAVVLLMAVAVGADEASDLASAQAVFEANLAAIAAQDGDAYLATYLESDDLIRTGFGGFELGYTDLEASIGEAWPEVFEGSDLSLKSIRPGIVYGTYRFRVRFDGNESAGLSERLFIDTEDGWKIAMTSAFEQPAELPPSPRALIGATLVDGLGGIIEDSVVVLRDGLIECAGSAEDCPAGAGIDRHDLSGKWLTPGLIDAHVHYSQSGWADGRPDSLDLRRNFPYDGVMAELAKSPERFDRAFLCSGVTAVFDNGGYAWTLDLDPADSEAPHRVAAGPLLSTVDHWINLPGEKQLLFAEDPDKAQVLVDYVAHRGARAVKVWMVGSTDEKVAAIVAAAGERAMRHDLPLIVHATELSRAKAAVAAGAHLLVHSIDERPIDDELIKALREAGTIVCPTLRVSDGYARMWEAAALAKSPVIDDPGNCLDGSIADRIASTAERGDALPDGFDHVQATKSIEANMATAADNLGRLVAAGIPIAAGTDAGNPLTVHGPSIYAELEAMQAAGMSPGQVLESATRIGSRALGLQETIGTVEAGKIADLLVLSADPTVDVSAFRELELVIRGGVIRSRSELAGRRYK